MNADLHKQLEALHSELERTTEVDRESSAMLATILNDISRLLETSRAGAITAPIRATSNASVVGAARDASLTERLDQMAVRFEAEHPTLGTAIRRVVDTLGKAGI